MLAGPNPGSLQVITDDEIAQVMAETGMDRIQAFHHLKMRQQLQHRPDPFPLGKSAYDAPEQQPPKGD